MPDATPPLPSARHGAPRRGILPVLVWTALAVMAVLLLWLMPNVVMIILWAALLAIVLRGGSDWIGAQTGLPGRFVLALLTVTVLGVWIGPKLAGQIQDLAGRLGSDVGQLRHYLYQTSWGRPIARGLSTGPQGGSDLMGPAKKTALIMSFRVIADGIVLVVTALYFAISPEHYIGGLVSLLPREHRARARRILGCTAAALQRLVLGQLVDMLTVGVLAAIGLRIANVPSPYALALIAGPLTFVPYFGAIIAAIPAVIVALSVGWVAALWIVLIFLVCHIVDGLCRGPLVQKRLLELPPAMSILSMMPMGTLFGPLGIVLGTPIAAVGLVLMREPYYPMVVGEPVRQHWS